MTTPFPDAVHEAARLWAMRVQSDAFGDWDGLTLWLESDPANREAYEIAVDDDVWAAELFAAQPRRSTMPAANAPPHPPRRRFTGFQVGAAAAAVVAVAAAGGWAVLDRDTSQIIATAPGEHRTIALADGTRVLMNGGTSISIDPDQTRQVTLARGEALFEVRHDARRPFVVMAGDTRLVDAGTVFNVVQNGGAVDVAVAEGAVLYDHGTRDIRLGAGDVLSRATATAAPIIRKASPQTIGTWRTGYLSYADVSLIAVATDLSRNIGRPIRVGDAAAAMRFSGTVMLDGPAEQVLARTAPLLGVRFVADGNGWTMVPADGASR